MFTCTPRDRISTKQREEERSLPATLVSGPAWSSVKDGMCFQGDRPEAHEREVVARRLEMEHETRCQGVYQGRQARLNKAEIELPERWSDATGRGGGGFLVPQKNRGWASERKRPRLSAVRDEGPWIMDMQPKPQPNR